MFDKSSIHIAVGVVLAFVVLHLVRSFMHTTNPKQSDGSDYIPGQPRA